MTGLNGINACVFDAYGTLFDVNAPVAKLRDEIGEKADKLAEIWRAKQLAYSWLRSLMRDYVEFWAITGDALDFAMRQLEMDDPDLRERLMTSYKTLDAYPEALDVLTALKQQGLATAILSNGSPNMLTPAVEHAGLANVLDAVISVDRLRLFKPDPRVYQLAVDELGVGTKEICFLSSNAWDAAGAAFFGLNVVWINRFRLPREGLPGEPMAEIYSLDELLPLLG